MTMKCVHKGCGKKFTDENEPCTYHPGPPVFHEGQKGWKCCKPRVLTFDEFMSIPPCTTGKHSTVDDTPAELKPTADGEAMNGTPAATPQSAPSLPTRTPIAPPSAPQTVDKPAAPESDSDELSATLPPSTECKRRGCNVNSSSCNSLRENEECVYHPGQALFHEGSKGWTCCKRRVLEFDEFMRIPGCKTRNRHCFVGKKRRKTNQDGDEVEDEFETLPTVRHDFYQTSTAVHASFFLKKIDKSSSKVDFLDSGSEVQLDLRTVDKKQYTATIPLYGRIDSGKSSYRVLGTKLELMLEKADGVGWPVLRSDEKSTGEIIQTGRAGRA